MGLRFGHTTSLLTDKLPADASDFGLEILKGCTVRAIAEDFESVLGFVAGDVDFSECGKDCDALLGGGDLDFHPLDAVVAAFSEVVEPFPVPRADVASAHRAH